MLSAVCELSGWCDLPDSVVAPATARRWVAATLASWNHRLSAADAATLAGLTSELVTNAVLHAVPAAAGTRDFRIRIVQLGGAGVRVEVHDPDPLLPTPGCPDLAAENGRGLLLVAAQADDWGAVRSGAGKYVWFSLACGGSASAPRDAAAPAATSG